jgi:hypothetical protein
MVNDSIISYGRFGGALCFCFYRCRILLLGHITVTAEKASKHIVDKNSSSRPHNGRFIEFSNTSMYLEKCKFMIKGYSCFP